METNVLNLLLISGEFRGTEETNLGDTAQRGSANSGE